MQLFFHCFLECFSFCSWMSPLPQTMAQIARVNEACPDPSCFLTPLSNILFFLLHRCHLTGCIPNVSPTRAGFGLTLFTGRSKRLQWPLAHYRCSIIFVWFELNSISPFVVTICLIDSEHLKNTVQLYYRNSGTAEMFGNGLEIQWSRTLIALSGDKGSTS